MIDISFNIIIFCMIVTLAFTTGCILGIASGNKGKTSSTITYESRITKLDDGEVFTMHVTAFTDGVSNKQLAKHIQDVATYEYYLNKEAERRELTEEFMNMPPRPSNVDSLIPIMFHCSKCDTPMSMLFNPKDSGIDWICGECGKHMRATFTEGGAFIVGAADMLMTEDK